MIQRSPHIRAASQPWTAQILAIAPRHVGPDWRTRTIKSRMPKVEGNFEPALIPGDGKLVPQTGLEPVTPSL